MSALNKAVTKKASKRRAEQRRDREAPYTLAPPDTARAVAKALPALRKTDIIVGLNALTRRLERDGVRWCALCDEAEPRALLDGVVELARRRDVPMLALPPGSGKADSPDTARAMISHLNRRRLEAAGAKLPPAVAGELIEVSPLVSYQGEGLGAYKKKKLEVQPALLIE